MRWRSVRTGRLRAAFLAGVLALAVLPLAANAELLLQYDVHYGPLTVLAVDARADITSATYRATTEMRTVGVLGFLFPWTSTATSFGSIAGTEWRPTKHRLHGTYRQTRRVVEIDYGDAGSIRALVEPPPAEDWRSVVPDTLQRATLDPLTASLAAVHVPCDRMLAVFDGRRRYNMHLRPLASSPPAHLDTTAGDRPRGCRANIEALAGFWLTDPRTSETPTYLDFWIATPDPDVGPVPVSLYLSGPAGALDIRLTSARRIAPPDA